MSESKQEAKMKEYFIRATSFAAPFFSDTSDGYVTAASPAAALKKFAAGYKHPCGLYSANCYVSADAYRKGEDALAQWLCNHELAKQKASEGKGSYGYYGDGPGHFKIDEEWITVKNPKHGRVVQVNAR